MKLIAHRGYKTKYIKENTMESFRNAFNNGFVGIECDVRKTKDNHLVICHDAFIDRVSDGAGLVSSFTYEELLKFNFGSKKVPSKIPLLTDVLKEFKGIKIIELKTRIDIDKITDFIDDNTYFISFDSSYMFKLKEKYPHLKFGVLNYVLNSNKKYDLNIICLLDNIMTERLESYFKNNGINIFIYGIKDKPKYICDFAYYITNNQLNKEN